MSESLFFLAPHQVLENSCVDEVLFDNPGKWKTVMKERKTLHRLIGDPNGKKLKWKNLVLLGNCLVVSIPRIHLRTTITDSPVVKNFNIEVLQNNTVRKKSVYIILTYSQFRDFNAEEKEFLQHLQISTGIPTFYDTKTGIMHCFAPDLIRIQLQIGASLQEFVEFAKHLQVCIASVYAWNRQVIVGARPGYSLWDEMKMWQDCKIFVQNVQLVKIL